MAAKRKSSGTLRRFGPNGSARALPARPSARRADFGSSVARLTARMGLAGSGLLSLALGILTLCVYAQVWRFPFITLDDPIYVSTNPHVRAGLTLAGIKWAFDRFYFANWAPLTWLSFMLDGSAYDAWAGGYHVTNVVLHLANVLLLFHVVKKATGQQLAGAFVAGLFAVHPIHAESVVWVSERKDVLSLLFALLSLSAYISYARRRRVLPFLLSLGLFTCSLMSKQTLVTLPCVLLLVDYWPLGRLSVRSALEKIPFFVISAVFCVIAVMAQSNALMVRSLDAIPFPMRMANAAVAYMSYLQKAILPWNLGVYYPYSTDLSLVRVGAAIALLVLITAAAFSSRRRDPGVLVGWLWFLGTLAPMIGLVQVGTQQMADRYAYFPFIGLYLAVAALVTSPRVAAAAVAVFAVLGFIQVGYWQDTITLIDHTSKVTTDNSFLHLARGDGLLGEARLPEALEQYRLAVVVAPADAGMHCKWASALFRVGQHEEARREFQTALALDDSLSAAHGGLAWCYVARKQTGAAKREFERALQLDPGDQDNHLNLALLNRQMGDVQASIEHCRGALAINDNLVPAHRLLAADLETLGRWEEAADRLRIILSLDPNDVDAREKLDAALRMAKHR